MIKIIVSLPLTEIIYYFDPMEKSNFNMSDDDFLKFINRKSSSLDSITFNSIEKNNVHINVSNCAVIDISKC